MRPYLPVALLALLPAAPVAPAAPASAAGGEGAIRKAAGACLEAIRKRDWKALAGHLHPDSLEEFKATVAPALRRAAAPGAGKGGVPDFQGGIVLGLLNGADPKGLLALRSREFFA